jgi:catechol 2,3-dioxygenase-like lactoylglutathione lyase family enzyme
MKLNLNQITIQVNDVERSISFYEKLGLRLIVKSLPKYARFECSEGETTFSLHQAENLKSENTCWIYFETNNLDKDVEALLQSGMQFEELPSDKPWLWREARLRDPGNNLVILYFAGDNRKNPPWRIKQTN